MEAIKRFQITPGKWCGGFSDKTETVYRCGTWFWNINLNIILKFSFFAGIYIHLLLVSLNMCQSQLEQNWTTCRRTQGHLSQHSQSDSQLTVTSKSIFQLTFFTPVAAFSISIQVTNQFSYWCITAFMTEYSGCNMWSWHSAAGTLRCQSRFKIPDIGRCVFLFLRF